MSSGSGFLEPRISRLLWQCGLAIGVLLIIVAVKFQTRQFLATEKAGEFKDRRYAALRFADSKRVLGILPERDSIAFEMWTPATGQTTRRTLSPAPNVPPAALRVASDLSYVAWTDGRSVELRRLHDNTPARINTSGTPVDVGLLPGGSIVVVYSDGAMERWQAWPQKLLERQRISLANPDQIAVDEDYVAAASSTEGKMVLYRQWEGAALRIVEESKCPPPPFQLVIAGHGQAALIHPGGIFWNGQTLNTPGKVSSLAFGFNSQLIAAGDFHGLYVVPKTEKPVRIAPGSPAGLITASDEFLVHSGADTLTFFRFALHARLTPTGTSLLWAGILFLVLAIILLLEKLIIDLLRKIVTRRRKVLLNVGKRFPPPPPDLLEAATRGALVLWAGAGLPAQSGLPSRRGFVRQLLEAGRFEGWLNASLSQKLQSLCERGQVEEAIDELVRGSGERRGVLVSYLKLSYLRTAALSRTHEALGDIPFAAAVTTNYDTLLDQIDPMWNRNILHPGAPVDPARVGNFFLLKLYGDILDPKTLILSRSELAAAAARPGGIAPLIAHVLDTTTVLFAGCSLDGLLQDLPRLTTPRAPARRHFVLAGVSDPGWERKAAELKTKWGMEVLGCLDEEVSAALPEFLEDLAARLSPKPEPLAV